MVTIAQPLRLVIFEINEISWELMESWLERGELPAFRRLRDEGCWAHTRADEKGGADGLLEPWVTWTTLYTGVPQEEHGVLSLEQPPETQRYPRLWDLVDQAGMSVGVFGSVGSWPPKKVRGFFVPGSFSPDTQTYPSRLEPIQDLNLGHTRAHAPGAKQPGLISMAASALRLWRLGLNARTARAIMATLTQIKLRPAEDWKKVSLQPIVNLAFFERLYRRYRPDFATFHTNHVAHYQHRFLRAWRPDLFDDPTDPREVERFGGAVRYGYAVSDKLLRRFMTACDRDPNLVLCVASSMGQKPFVPERYGKAAPPTCRIRSIERLVDLLEMKGRCEFFSVMAPQWNVRIADAQTRESFVRHLHAARYQPLNKSMYNALAAGDTIVVTPISHHGLGPTTDCVFSTLPGSPTFRFDELVVQDDETRKSGCHDPIGMIAFYGRKVRSGHNLGELNNLDIAPTLLNLLGVTVPDYLTGRSFAERIVNQKGDACVASAAVSQCEH